MTDVLKVGGDRDDEAGGVVKDPEETEPNSETASFRDVEVMSQGQQPSTTSTVLSDKDHRFFSFEVVDSSTPTQAQANASLAEAAFHVESPGRLIRATDSLEPDDSVDKRGQSTSANTRF